MTDDWPPLDMHAHVDVRIAPQDLLALRAVVFAASRTLAESEEALGRQAKDLLTVWGLGVHPGVKESLDTFEPLQFSALLEKTAYVGEVGLDGKARGRLPRQQEILSEVLAMLQKRPRITSLHSYGATNQLIEQLQIAPIKGAVLHWWLGDEAATARAVEIGAYFSINTACLRNPATLTAIPLERILLETDHPDGDRRTPPPRRPGRVENVEEQLAARHGLSPREMRLAAWRNLKRLVSQADCGDLLPKQIASMLGAIQP